MKHVLLLLLFLIGLLLSTFIAVGLTGSVCEPGSSCEIVQGSAFGEFLGIKLHYWGVGVFAGLCLLTLFVIRTERPSLHRLLHVGVMLLGISGVYLLSVQAFFLRTFCPFCILVDSICILAVLILWSDNIYRKK